jgi:REP element-mobilizing transposase RayT
MMPRHPRVFLEGGTYHVYSRVTRREPIFADAAAADLFTELLAKVKARDGLVLYAWVLMSNHYHLVVRTVEVPLWRTMASLQVGFTKRFNRTHGLVGPLWQGRYKAKLVDSQRYFDQLLAYVHLNPVAAGVVTDPADYEYSGHREIVARAKAALVDVDEVLAAFGSKRATARRRYASALKGAQEADWIGELPGRLPWWGLKYPPAEERDSLSPRGDLPFVDELGRSTGLERPPLKADNLVTLACEKLGVSREGLIGPGRDRQVVRAREAIALVAVERYALRLKDIADELQKNQDTASRWLSRAAARRRDDTGFAELVHALDQTLARSSG